MSFLLYLLAGLGLIVFLLIMYAVALSFLDKEFPVSYETEEEIWYGTWNKEYRDSLKFGHDQGDEHERNVI